MNFKQLGTIVGIIAIIIGIILIISVKHAEKTLEEIKNSDTNIYCQASIECENNCNHNTKGDSFLTCRWQCLTLKNCD